MLTQNIHGLTYYVINLKLLLPLNVPNLFLNTSWFELLIIQIENAKEFLALQSLLTDYDIKHRLTCSYNHEKTGLLSENTDM